jgi:hypothetical protein
VIIRLRNHLWRALEGATDAANASRRAASVAADLVQLRIRLHHTHYLERNERGQVKAIIREAERLLARRLDSVEQDRQWSVLLKEWNRSLVEAAEKVDRDEDLSAEFAAYAEEETDAEREFGRVGFAAAAARWRDA